MRGAAFVLLLAATSASASGPSPGRYDATLCVRTSPATPPSCGAAEFELRDRGRAQVRVADVVYRLHLRPRQLDVSTMQGTTQIDEFSAHYEWQDRLLRFNDDDKNVRYEVKVGAKRRAPR
jgi:hypothetical protein